MNILLIDDKRSLAGITKTVRNYNTAIDALKETLWNLVVLDHDLGDFDENGKERTGYDILCWLEQNQQYLPKRIELITNNPSARLRMQLVIDKLYDPIA